MNELRGVTIFLPGFAAFVIAAILGPVIIPFLRSLKARQTVRDDGPQTHLAKNGTPTMGGFIFLIPFCAVCIFLAATHRTGNETLAILAGTLLFSFIGFIDDFIKVILKRSMGLRAWQKFLLQVIFAAGLIAYMKKFMDLTSVMKLPFVSMSVDWGIFSYILMGIAIVATVNGSNFTDGLDGLASSVTIVIGVFLILASLSIGSVAYAPSSAMTGALMGFLLYNSHKASVFMGDTGSLALGAFVAVTCIVNGQTLFLPFLAFIYLAEVLSVIIQVSYFKATKGKRIFKMAPIHHHFELCDWTETKVVNVFSIITAAIAMVLLFDLVF